MDGQRRGDHQETGSQLGDEDKAQHKAEEDEDKVERQCAQRALKIREKDQKSSCQDRASQGTPRASDKYKTSRL